MWLACLFLSDIFAQQRAIYNDPVPLPGMVLNAVGSLAEDFSQSVKNSGSRAIASKKGQVM